MRVMKLYYAPGACSLAPHIVLEEVGDRFELSRVDLAANQQNSTGYLRINAKARARLANFFALTRARAAARPIPPELPTEPPGGGNYLQSEATP